jgi:hypothetical protein
VIAEREPAVLQRGVVDVDVPRLPGGRGRRRRWRRGAFGKRSRRGEDERAAREPLDVDGETVERELLDAERPPEER